VLSLALLGELIYSLAAMAVFVLTSERQRARYRAFLTGADMSIRRSIPAVLLGLSLVFLGACREAPQSKFGSGAFPGSSFEFQVEQLKWSTKTLLEMDYTGKTAFDDFVTIFIGDEKELSTYYLSESFEMLGW